MLQVALGLVGLVYVAMIYPLCDLVGDGANAVAKEIQAAGGKAHAFPMDVTNGQGTLDAVAFGVKEFGSVDVLVNNAAIDVIEPVQEVSQESWNRILDVNLTGVFQCSQAARRSDD